MEDEQKKKLAQHTHEQIQEDRARRKAEYEAKGAALVRSMMRQVFADDPAMGRKVAAKIDGDTWLRDKWQAAIGAVASGEELHVGELQLIPLTEGCHRCGAMFVPMAMALVDAQAQQHEVVCHKCMTTNERHALQQARQGMGADGTLEDVEQRIADNDATEEGAAG